MWKNVLHFFRRRSWNGAAGLIAVFLTVLAGICVLSYNLVPALLTLVAIVGYMRADFQDPTGLFR